MATPDLNELNSAMQEAPTGMSEVDELDQAMPEILELDQAMMGEFAPQEPIPPAEFSPEEVVIRSARQGVKGLTLGISEPYFSGTTAIAQTVAEMLESGKIDDAKTFVKKVQDYYRQESQRQKEFQQEYPTTALTSELAGGLAMPTAAAERLMVEAGPGLIGAIKSGFGTGIKAGAVMGAAEQLEQAPYTDKTTEKRLEEFAETTAMGGIAGAVATPVLTAGAKGLESVVAPIEAGVSGYKTAGLKGLREGVLSNIRQQYTAAKGAIADIGPSIKRKIGEKLSSEFSLKVAETFLGLDPKSMKSYMEFEKEVLKLDSPDKVEAAFNSLQSALKEELATAQIEEREIEQVWESAKQALQFEKERKSSTQKAILEAAELKLEQIKREIQSEVALAKERAQLAKAEYRDRFALPDISREASVVQEAVEKIQTKLKETSAAARELLNPDIKIRKLDIENAISEIQKKLFIGETKPVGAEAKRTFEALERYKRGLYETRVPPSDYEAYRQTAEFSQPELKSLLKQIDDDISAKSFISASDDFRSKIMDTRRAIDAILKSGNKDYAAAMEPVADLTKFYVETLVPTFGNTADVNQKITQKMYSAARDNRLYDVFEQLARRSEVDVVEPVNRLRKILENKSNRKKFLDERSLPEMQDLRDLENLIQLESEAVDDLAILNALPTSMQGMAKKLIEGRNALSGLKMIVDNPASGVPAGAYSYSDAQLEMKLSQAVRKQEISVAEADALRKKAIEKRQKIEKVAQQWTASYPTTGHLVDAFLQNPQAREGTAVAQAIKALELLPDEALANVLKQFDFSDVKNLENFVKLLRIRESVYRSEGNKRLITAAFFGGAFGGAVGGINGPVSGLTGLALGALGGPMLSQYGPKLTTSYLSTVSQLRGIPTARKLINASPVPLPPELKASVNQLILDMATSNQDKASTLVPVNDENVDAILQDIDLSQLNSVEKAKAIQEVYKYRLLSRKTLNSIMLEGLQTSTPKSNLGARLAEPQAPKVFKEDRPDILKALTKKPKLGA